MTVLVIIVLAMTAFEGFLDTSLWLDLMVGLGQVETDDGFDAPVLTTVVFVAFSAVLYAIFYMVSGLTRRFSVIPSPLLSRSGSVDSEETFNWTTAGVAGLFVLSLVPIAIAYHIAHYLFWFTVHIQDLIPVASDPFGWGWDLFGKRDYAPDITAVGLGTIWHTGIVVIVIGHVIAVNVAHRKAFIVFGSRRAALWSQLPMLILMVAYTMSSLWMLAQPIMG